MKVKDIQVWPSLRMKLLTEGLQARARARAHSKFETFTLLCFYQILSFWEENSRAREPSAGQGRVWRP